jgi:hypothetical protein
MKLGLYKHASTVIRTEKFRLLAKFNSLWQQRNTTGCTVEKKYKYLGTEKAEIV